MPSRLSKLLQGTAVASLTTIGAFFVWTKHCKFEELDPATDPAFQSTFYKKFNATPNPTTHDLCVRRIPIFKIRKDLTQDAAAGGSKLVEAFCAGIWAASVCLRGVPHDIPSYLIPPLPPRPNLKPLTYMTGYTIQRAYLRAKYKDARTAHQLWTTSEQLSSTYDVGTEITDHFVVLSKTASSIVVRCGDSPLNTPDGPRPSDGLFEITAELHADEGFCEFRLKSLFYQGLGASATGEPPMGGFMWWAHKQYTKLWMESAVRNVTR